MPAATEPQGSRPVRIAVIGAGILGLATAVALVRRGASVVLIDQDQPVSGTSSTSFAWVNSNGKEPRAYHDLNVAGLAGHLDWQKDLPADFRWFRQTGAFECAGRDGGDELVTRVEALRASGYAAELVTRDVVERANPGLRVPDGPIAAFREEGYVEVSRFAAWSLLTLREAGTLFRFGQTIAGIDRSAAGVAVTLESGETVVADRVLLAAGRWTRQVLARLGFAFAAPELFDPTPLVKDLLAFTAPVPVQLGSLIFTPDINLRPDGGGRLVLQSRDLRGRFATEADLSPGGALAVEYTRRLRQLLPFVPPGAIESVRTGRRSLTDDGLPAAGWIDERIYILATHSGVTLAPTLADNVAHEVVSGLESAALAPFRPDRLLTPAGHAGDLPLHSRQ